MILKDTEENAEKFEVMVLLLKYQNLTTLNIDGELNECPIGIYVIIENLK